jgi:hypothetical protein
MRHPRFANCSQIQLICVLLPAPSIPEKVTSVVTLSIILYYVEA